MWIGPSLGISGQNAKGGGAVPPVNLIGALPWQTGASTALSIAGGRARATATNGAVDNPRIFKGPFTATSGVTYRYKGTMYPGTVITNMFLRICLDTTIANNGPVQAIGDTSGPLALDGTWTAVGTVALYVGLVGVVDANGQYTEIDDNFSITVVP